MKTFQFFLLFIAAIFHVKAQSEDLLKSPSVVFFGIDFREARLIGSAGFTNPYHIKSEYFDSWNQLMATEKEKYDIKKYFGKKEVQYSFGPVSKANQTVDPDKLVINDPYTLNTDKIPALVRSYEIDPELKGLGLVFIVESFDKLNEKGTYYAVFFDIKTRKVLSYSKRVGAPGGFGLRNYWARAILNGMQKGPVK
ncbi:MAG: hypothetical protein N2110_08035 [Flavobacteriales bacterium]|nr:hypothetical protein [Flavobacteriales bacterium]